MWRRSTAPPWWDHDTRLWDTCPRAFPTPSVDEADQSKGVYQLFPPDHYPARMARAHRRDEHPRHRPRAEEYDRKAAFPRESLHALRDAGLWSMRVPQQYGGLGLDLVTTCLIVEEVAKNVRQRRCALRCISKRWRRSARFRRRTSGNAISSRSCAARCSPPLPVGSHMARRGTIGPPSAARSPPCRAWQAAMADAGRAPPSYLRAGQSHLCRGRRARHGVADDHVRRHGIRGSPPVRAVLSRCPGGLGDGSGQRRGLSLLFPPPDLPSRGVPHIDIPPPRS